MKKQKNILLFYPHNPVNPIHGSHLRILQQISEVREIGRIIFTSSVYTSDTFWPLDLSSELSNLGVHSIEVYGRSLREKYLERPLYKVTKLIDLVTSNFSHGKFTFSLSNRLLSFFMQRWFAHLALSYQIEVIIVHYSDWISIADKIKSSVPRIIELHDILPVNRYLQQKVKASYTIDGSHVRTIESSKTIGYISSCVELPEDLRREVRLLAEYLRRYDLVWTIADREKNFLQEIESAINIDTILPFFRKKSDKRITKTVNALLPIGPNIFNTYGLINFITKIEPGLQYPIKGQVVITGKLFDAMPVLPNKVYYRGLVANYIDYLMSARFVIVSTMVGTGQQMKIFESLSFGIPVVCFKCAVPKFMQYEDVGVVCVPDNNYEEFTKAINRLWHDDLYFQRVCEGARRFPDFMSKSLSYKMSLAKLLNKKEKYL